MALKLNAWCVRTNEVCVFLQDLDDFYDVLDHLSFKPYAGLCNVQLYDKYLHLLHQLKLQSGATTPGVDDARPHQHSPAVIDTAIDIAEMTFTLQWL